MTDKYIVEIDGIAPQWLRNYVEKNDVLTKFDLVIKFEQENITIIWPGAFRHSILTFEPEADFLIFKIKWC